MPPEMCLALLDAIRDDLGISVDNPDSWDQVSSQVDQLPLWGHQSQWDIRELAQLHSLFSAVWGTRRLWADRNSCRFTPPWREGRAEPLRIHRDVDPRDRQQLWYQGVLALTPAPKGGGWFPLCPGPDVQPGPLASDLDCHRLRDRVLARPCA